MMRVVLFFIPLVAAQWKPQSQIDRENHGDHNLLARADLLATEPLAEDRAELHSEFNSADGQRRRRGDASNWLLLATEPLAEADRAELNSALLLGMSAPLLGDPLDCPESGCPGPCCRRLAAVPENLLQNVQSTGTADGMATAASAETIEAVVNAWPIPDDTKPQAATTLATIAVTEQSTEFQTFRVAIDTNTAEGAYSFIVGAGRKNADDTVQIGYVFSTSTGTVVQQTETQHWEERCCKRKILGACVDYHTCSGDNVVNRGVTAEELVQIATALQESAEEYARATLGAPVLLAETQLLRDTEPLAEADLLALDSALLVGIAQPLLGDPLDCPESGCPGPCCRRLAAIPENLLQNVETTGTKDGMATVATTEQIEAVVNAWPIPDDAKPQAATALATVAVTEQSTEFQTFRLAVNTNTAEGAYSFIVGAGRKVADDQVQVGYVFSTATGTVVQQTETQHWEEKGCKTRILGICVDHYTRSGDNVVNRGVTAEELEQIATALQESAEEYARSTLGAPATSDAVVI